MFTSVREVLVEWGDCDPVGIVYFPRYLAWFDACTHALFRNAGCAMTDLQDRFGMAGLPAVEVRATFSIPSRPGDTVRIESSIAEFRRSSFDVHHRMQKDGALAGEGWETRVWVVVDPAQGGKLASRPVPDAVRAAFA